MIILRRGSVLVISMWALCLLSVFAASLAIATKQRIILVKRLIERETLHYIAEAGVKQAILEITKDASKDYDALTDIWANNKIDGQMGQGKFQVSIIDEERKLNINRADQTILRELFRGFGMDEMETQNLAASIIDWRDEDSELSMPLGSAESQYYEYLSEPYEAKDGDFETLQEVLLVKGVTEEVFEKIKDSITIYGDGRININTASFEVLASLGMSDGLVSKIMRFRYGPDGSVGGGDDNIFINPETVVAQLSQYYIDIGLSDSEVAELSNIISGGSIATTSNYFRVESVAGFNNADEPLQKIVCVVKRTGEFLSYIEF